MKKVLLVICITVFATVAGAQETIDGEALAAAIEAAGLVAIAPAWLAGLIPPLIIVLASIVNAIFKDKNLGPVAGIVNKAALAFGNAKTNADDQA